MLERGLGVEIKCHITLFREPIKLQVAPKKEVENHRSWFLTLEFPPIRAGFPLCKGNWGKSGNLLEDQEKSGKFNIFGKSQGRKFLSMQIFNF